MEKKGYKNYFLGLMSAEDAETLELQIISDEEVEAELLQAENDLIEDYLDGNLTNEEVKAFNLNFLVTKERRERVEFVQMITDYAQNVAVTSATIKKNKPNFFEQLKYTLNPRKFAFGFGGIALILAIGFISYLSWNNYSSRSEVLVSLNKAYKNNRPTEARITDFDYAPKTEGTRGNDDKTQDLNFVSAKSRATEAVLKNETAENLHELGRVYLAEKNFDEAIKQFEKAIKKNPDLAKLHNDLGVAFMEKAKQKEEGKLELFAKANEEIEKSIELDKNLTEAYFNRGLVIESLNLPNQAKEAWENYLKLDSTSQWADEARQHLQKLETNKPISKTKEEILQDFLQAKQANDTEKAWQTLSRNREMSSGKLIPQQLVFLFVDSKTNGDETKAKEALDAIVYAGNLEGQKANDPFWREVANYYSYISNDKILLLKNAHDSIRKGHILRIEGRLEESLKEFESAENIFRDNNVWEAKLCNYWIGVITFQLTKLEKSNDIFINLVEICERNNFKWLATHSYVRLTYGVSSQNKYSKSIEYSIKALKFAEQTNDFFNLQRIFSSLAYDYKSLGQYELAFKFSEKSLALIGVASASSGQKWETFESLTRVLTEKKMYKTAILYQVEALRTAQEKTDVINEQLSIMYLGMLYQGIGEYEESKKYFEDSQRKADGFESRKAREKALAFTNLKYAHLERISENYDKSVKLYRLATDFYSNSEFQLHNYEAHKGELLCYIQTKNDSEIQRELPIILEIFKKYRKEILEEQNRNSFFDNEQSVYDIAIDYEFDKANYANAFDFLEESRSRSLLDLQNSAIEVSKEEKQPQIKFSSNVFEPLKISKIQAEISENVQLVEYVVLPDKVLIWLITKDNLSVAKVEISSEKLQEKILTYLGLVSKNIEPNEQRQLSTELYNILISPIKEKLDAGKEVFLIPDKILFRLPFATLFSDKYLIEDYKISYAPSANVFLFCSKRARELDKSNSETLLSIGNPTFNQASFEGLQPLPSAKEEAQEIAKNYDNSIVFTEKATTKETIKNNLKKADVIHFAGHYLVDEHSPLLSGLVLAGDKKEDSSLANYEIISEKFLHTRLIVLSACQTGIEKYFNGEGMIGASRTFLATGVPVVVASQWQVDSEATAKLMIDFHRRRKTAKLSTLEALRSSQLEMLKTGKFQQPYYWAAFATIGGYARF